MKTFDYKKLIKGILVSLMLIVIVAIPFAGCSVNCEEPIFTEKDVIIGNWEVYEISNGDIIHNIGDTTEMGVLQSNFIVFNIYDDMTFNCTYTYEDESESETGIVTKFDTNKYYFNIDNDILVVTYINDDVEGEMLFFDIDEDGSLIMIRSV